MRRVAKGTCGPLRSAVYLVKREVRAMKKVRVTLEAEAEAASRTQWTATLGTLSVSANSSAEARAWIAKEVRAALEGPYTPLVVACDGQSAVIWREPRYGWQYVCNPGDGDLHSAGPFNPTRDDAERMARRDLAQRVDGRRIAAGLPPIGASLIQHSMDYDRHTHWVHWQEAHHAATQCGLSDAQARAYALACTTPASLERACQLEHCPVFDLPAPLAEVKSEVSVKVRDRMESRAETLER